SSRRASCATRARWPSSSPTTRCAAPTSPSDKPAHLGPAYGAQFADPSVVRAYRHRPPYPDEVHARLARLAAGAPPVLLELGCGPGEIARRALAWAREVHAVDPVRSMLAAGRAAPGGDDPRLHWVESTAEAFPYPARYGLVVAAESLHWMDWARVVPAIGAALAPGGRLAVVVRRRFDRVPWWAALLPVIQRFSTNREFRPYDLLD